jgi:hypothetical protein
MVTTLSFYSRLPLYFVARSTRHAWPQQLACWLDFGCHSRDPELPPLVLASIFELVAAVMVSPDLPLPARAASLTSRCLQERRDVGLMLEETVVHITPLIFSLIFFSPFRSRNRHICRNHLPSAGQ